MWEGFNSLHLCTAILWAADCLGRYTDLNFVSSNFSSCIFFPSHQLWRITNGWANCVGTAERLQLWPSTHSIHWASPVNVSIAPWKLDRIHCIPLREDNKGFCWAESAKAVYVLQLGVGKVLCDMKWPGKCILLFRYVLACSKMHTNSLSCKLQGVLAFHFKQAYQSNTCGR